jgi:hypothetical protein
MLTCMFVSHLSTGEFAIDQKAVETSGAEQVLPAAAPAGQPEQGPGAHILPLHCRVPCFDLFIVAPHATLLVLSFAITRRKQSPSVRFAVSLSQCSKY